MYNSVVVRSLVRLWSFFSGFYQQSFVKKVADSIVRFFVFLFNGSEVEEIFVSEKSLIEPSVFYRIYSWIVDLANKILKTINFTIKRWEKGSSLFSVMMGVNRAFNMFVVKTNIKVIFLNSKVVKFIIDLFSADEVGDQWW